MTQASTPHCVYLHKTCPEHGIFCVPVWDASRGGPPFATWSRPKSPSRPVRPGTAVDKGCPYDCGLCPEHGQHTCTGLVEVTQRCSMGCPVCYAAAGQCAEADPSLDALDTRFAALHRASAGCNVQLSGGEPTERDDLPRIVALARRYAFGLLQLNTNGRRLALEPAYAVTLRKSGLDSVYLQWDGVSEDIFQHLRGQACLAWKQTALKHCLHAGLGVVLVATLVRGVNTGEMGALLRWALKQGAGVRGVHFQPMAAFGRCPWTAGEAPRFTLPELIHALETQAPEFIKAGQLHPPGCEHSLCSCSAVYRRSEKGLECIPSGGCCEGKIAGEAAEGARKAKQFTALHWRGGEGTSAPQQADPFSRFVAGAGVEQRFTVSAMAFQDTHSLDLDRVRGCCIHVVSDDGRLIPFCLYNLTSEEGLSLYRQGGGVKR
ncbi:MAG: radical SAM protein [Desulfovibrionaceae bacterium]